MTELEKIRRFPAPLLQSDLVTHISEEAAEQFAMGIPPEGLDQLGEHLQSARKLSRPEEPDGCQGGARRGNKAKSATDD